jgi:hemolysin III
MESRQNNRQKPRQPLYSIPEEIANSVSHGIGTALSIAGLITLAILAILFGDHRQVISVLIYGSTLVLLYLASTLYHATQQPKLKKIFQKFDHSAIFLLIAGTYTPFLVISLWGKWGWILLGLIWGLALFGIGFKAFFIDRFHRISAVGYLLMGWLGAFVGIRLLSKIPLVSLSWLAAGGVIYTIGVIFLAWRRIPFNHAVWHIFVLAGSACHFIAVYYLLPNL